MAELRLNQELDQKLHFLERNFFNTLKNISGKRLQLENQSLSVFEAKIKKQNLFRRDKEIKSAPHTFTIHLEPSLGSKLAKSRGIADNLEEKLQEIRVTFEDKLQTKERINKELAWRETLLIKSVQEIETYMRATFYLKQETDDMHIQLRKNLKEQEVKHQEIRKKYDFFKQRANSLQILVSIFQSAKNRLENIVTVFNSTRYSNARSLIEYYLVLKHLKHKLLAQELEVVEDEEHFANEKLQLAAFKQQIPLIQATKENILLDLKSTLHNMKIDVGQLNEQVELTLFTKLTDDAFWYKMQKWIKKLFQSSRQVYFLGSDEATNTILDQLDRIKNFVAYAQKVVEKFNIAKKNIH